MAYDDTGKLAKNADEARDKAEEYLNQAHKASASQTLRNDCLRLAEVWAQIYHADVLRGG